MNEDAAFQKWFKANPPMGDSEGIAYAAWKAALERASQFAFDSAKRYTCKRRRGICFAIADQIKKGSL